MYPHNVQKGGGALSNTLIWTSVQYRRRASFTRIPKAIPDLTLTSAPMQSPNKKLCTPFFSATLCVIILPFLACLTLNYPLHLHFLGQGQSHCLLLMEPVLLPNLGHTDVGRETLPGDRPLFYPNGYKNCCLGTNVRNALFQSSTRRRPGAAMSTEPRQQQYYGGTTSNPQQAYVDQSHDRHGCWQDGPQDPPSDWAGSSAYYSLPSESSCSGYNGNGFACNKNR